MKKLLLPLFILLCATGARGQGILYQINPPAPNAQVLVCPSPDNGYPCPSPVTIYSDSGLSVVVNQPVQLGSSGFLTFYVAAGTYTIQLMGPGYNSSNRKLVTVGGGGTPATSVPFSGITSASNTTAAMHVGTGASLDATGSGTVHATTSDALAATPTLCSGGTPIAAGILANGNATGCQAAAGISSFHVFGSTGATACNGAGTNQLGWEGVVGSCSNSLAIGQMVAPGSGTVVAWTVVLSAAPGAGNSVDIVIQKNGSATAVTCNISGAVATSCSDTTHTFNYVINDLLNVAMIATGGQNAATVKWGVKINGT